MLHLKGKENPYKSVQRWTYTPTKRQKGSITKSVCCLDINMTSFSSLITGYDFFIDWKPMVSSLSPYFVLSVEFSF